MTVSLADSYDLCHRIARRTAKNFYFSFLGLPKPRFQAMCALYTYMRISDDIGDDETLPLEQRRADMTRWEDIVRRSLAGEDVSSDDGPVAWAQRVAALPAISDMVRSFQIPQHYLFDVLKGVGMDLDVGTSDEQQLTCRFETFEQLEQYCYHVAGVVGLCCIHIWGIRDQRALPRAIDCGLAFQLTNILRDVGEDAEVGRVYLPAEDLRRFDYSPEQMRQRVRNLNFRDLMDFEAGRAKACYARAEELFDFLEPVGHPILAAMMDIYGGLLRAIEQRQFDVYSGHVSLPKWRKLCIAGRAILQQHKILRLPARQR